LVQRKNLLKLLVSNIVSFTRFTNTDVRGRTERQQRHYNSSLGLPYIPLLHVLAVLYVV